MPASCETRPSPPYPFALPPHFSGSSEQEGQAQHLNFGNFGMCR